MNIPQRLSLVGQAAQVLRDEIVGGRWKKVLPGERNLAATMHVSRSTLRQALAVLHREGLFRIQAHRRLLVGKISSRKTKSNLGVVVLLTTLKPDHLSQMKLREADDLRRLLGDAPMKLELRLIPHFSHDRSPERLIEPIASELGPACWVLSGCPKAVQRWFSNSRLPAIITGSSHPGVSLPAIDIDNYGIARHAVGNLLARGHRQITLLNPNSGFAGDLAIEKGFQDAIKASPHPEVKPRILYHDGLPESLHIAAQKILKSTPRPTAILLSHVNPLITMLTSLQASGVHVPRDVSLVSLRDDMDLSYLAPTIAHYHCNWELFNRKLSTMVIKLATDGTLRKRQTVLSADFVAGNSLATLV